MTPCERCASLALDLAAETTRANGLAAERAQCHPACERCAALGEELARTLRALADAHEREAALLDSLTEWNRAAAAALDGRPEVER